jgi:gliding motility-associated-like protein
MRKIIYSLIILAVFNNAFSQVPNYVPKNGLLGWWPFTGNALDSSGNGNNGAITGATLTTDRFGRSNCAYNFDGVNDYIQVLSNSKISNLNELSISCWVNINSIPSFLGGIVTKWQGTLNCNSFTDHYGLWVSNDTRIVAGSNNYQFFPNQTLNTAVGTKKWYHIVFVKSVSNGGLLYINGKLAVSNKTNSTACNSTNPLYFGCDQMNGNRNRFYNGKIDDIGLWNRSLTECEISALYKASIIPTVSIGKDTQSFCGVDSAKLTATSGFASYNWSNGKKGASVYVNATGPISVTATDSFGCSATDDALISIQNPRILPRDTIVCSGQAVNLRLKGSAGMGVSYLWSTGDTKSTTRIQTAGTTQVWLKQFNGIGTCYDTTTVRISNPVLNVAADTLRFTNCKRDSLRLSVGKKWKSVQWSHGPKDSAVFLKTTGKYSVRVQDTVGCFTADTFNFINPGRVQASITRTDSVKCFNGSTGSASGTATGGFTPLQYRWSNGQVGTNATGLQQGNYAFIATDAYGCADTVIASVQQPTRTVISIAKIDSITCYNFSNGRITTSGAGGTLPYQFRWQGGQTGNTISNLPAGTYRVLLTDKNGCKDSVNIILSNPPEVIARIVSGNMTMKGQNMDVAAQVTPAGNYTYQWQPASVFGSNANRQNATIQLSNNTKLLLTATNTKGCVGKDSLEIGVVQPLKDIIPNAFSPNKDGLNEGFGLPDIFEIETFQVYDRWGGIIFKGSSSIPRWNGYAGNEPVPAGTYSYQITAKLKGGIQTVSYTGKVTVVK